MPKEDLLKHEEWGKLLESIHPDFTVRHPITGKRIYWEHFGMMDDQEYRNDGFEVRV